jgi:hypothetical protein
MSHHASCVFGIFSSFLDKDLIRLSGLFGGLFSGGAFSKIIKTCSLQQCHSLWLRMGHLALFPSLVEASEKRGKKYPRESQKNMSVEQGGQHSLLATNPSSKPIVVFLGNPPEKNHIQQPFQHTVSDRSDTS